MFPPETIHYALEYVLHAKNLPFAYTISKPALVESELNRFLPTAFETPFLSRHLSDISLRPHRFPSRPRLM